MSDSRCKVWSRNDGSQMTFSSRTHWTTGSSPGPTFPSRLRLRPVSEILGIPDRSAFEREVAALRRIAFVGDSGVKPFERTGRCDGPG